MAQNWSGNDGVLNSAVARLVIRDRYRFRRGRSPARGRGPLVLDVVGGTEESRASLLRKLGEEYRRITPVAHIRTTGAAGRARAAHGPVGAGGRGEGAQALVDEMSEIAAGCGHLGRPNFRLPVLFPRFRAVECALRGWEGQEGNHTQAVEGLAGAVKEAVREEKRKSLAGLRGRVDELVSGGERMGILAGLVGWVLAGVKFLSPPPHLTAQRWLRRRLSAPPGGVYESLSQWGEEDLEGLLAEAFLADVDAYYNRFRRWNRTRLPLVLLPEVGRNETRRRVGQLLRDTYRSRRGPLRTAPVVITTEGGEDPGPVEGDGDLAENLAHTGELRMAAPAGTVAPSGGGGSKSPFWPAPWTAVLVVTALAAGGWFGYHSIQNWARDCGSGVEMRGEDCVGVSATKQFMPELKEVTDRIMEENREVGKRAGEHVTIAVMQPMEADAPAEKAEIRSELQGAYLAQYRANHRSDGKSPDVRLVLANPGRGYAHWEFPAEQLGKMAHARGGDLRAVVGFNLSLQNTRDAVDDLTNDKGIPVVAGPVTSDALVNTQDADGKQKFDGLARVVPSNGQQAEALRYFNSDVEREDAALVEDTREKDSYNSSLAKAFSKAASKEVKSSQFTSPAIDEVGRTPNQLNMLAGNICQSDATTIYFAGRPLHLKVFLTQLAKSPCRDKKYTVITGSHGSRVVDHMKPPDWRTLQTSGITVQYAAAGHPSAWNGDPQDPRAQKVFGESGKVMDELEELRKDRRVRPMGDVSFTDSRAMVMHDAMWTAVFALQQLMSGSQDGIPALDDVKGVWQALHSDSRVEGATGWICLTNAGNPYDKAVPVVKLDPEARRPRFEGVAWPTGKPPAKDCVVPRDAK